LYEKVGVDKSQTILMFFAKSFYQPNGLPDSLYNHCRLMFISASP